MKTDVLDRIVNSPSDRRKFMKRVGRLDWEWLPLP